MQRQTEELNNLLVGGYDKVAAMEQLMLLGQKQADVSIAEMHLIEYIAAAGEGGRTISELAAHTGKAMPSITVCVKKLQARGFVQKVRRAQDGRVVHVTLTQKGRRVDISHRYFHRKMVRALMRHLTPEDEEALIRGLGIINAFLDDTIAAMGRGDK